MKVWRAKAEGLVIDAGSGPDSIPWAEIGTAGLESLARACGLPRTPEDRLGLGIYYSCGGDRARAQAMFDALRGTSLDAEATRFRERLGK